MAPTARLLDEDPGVHLLAGRVPEPRMVSPRTTAPGRRDGDDAALARPVEDRARLALDGQLARDPDRTRGARRAQDDHGVAVGRQVDDRPAERRPGRPTIRSALRRRDEAGGECRRQPETHDGAKRLPWRQVACGSTSMRPCISMCMAWQNQVQ